MSNISRKNVIINCELTYQGGIFVTKTIEQLWSGTLEHKMKLEENNAELKELKNLINRNGEHLSETFNEKEKEIFEKQNKTTKKPESDSKRKTSVNKPGIKENEQKKLREQQNENNKTMTIEESEQKMDSVIDMRKKFIDFGMGYKGINYVWGGKTPRPGFDCSGFVSYTAKQSLGIDVRGNAQDIYNQTSPVSLGEALPGDLIFFKGASDSRITHVGIYLGKNPGQNDFGKQNLFLNAASGGPRTGVIISGLNENYWKKTFYGCGRLIPEI